MAYTIQALSLPHPQRFDPISDAERRGSTYQEFSSLHGNVDVLQRAIDLLKYLGGPEGTVDVDPVVLVGVQQSSCLLHTNHRHIQPDLPVVLVGVQQSSCHAQTVDMYSLNKHSYPNTMLMMIKIAMQWSFTNHKSMSANTPSDFHFLNKM